MQYYSAIVEYDAKNKEFKAYVVGTTVQSTAEDTFELQSNIYNLMDSEVHGEYEIDFDYSDV